MDHPYVTDRHLESNAIPPRPKG